MKAQLFCVGMFQKRNKEYISFFKEDETRAHNGNIRSTSYISLFMAVVAIVIFFQQNDT
jgi:hypothetical protein